MRRIIIALAAILTLAPFAGAQSKVDLKSILSGLTGSADTTSTTTDASTSSEATSGIGDLLGNLFGGSKLTVESMTGDWKYKSPAVSFKSDNLLKKAGGAAASAAVESKLAPYYKKAGFQNMTLTVATDSTFTMKVGRVNLKGTISTAPEGSDANFIFNFKVAGKLPIGKMDTYVSMTGSNSMSVMFDVSKLVTIIEAVGNVSGSSTVKGVTSVLKGYDGICAGFRLTK